MNTFHLRDGWFFRRLSNGSVSIEKLENAKETSPIVSYINISPEEWASVVASVSKHGDFNPYYQQALDFHG